MSYLFQITERAVFPNPETLLISPFKDIWERDTSENKEVAIAELTYIEFVSSMHASNPYRQYPEEEKPAKVKKECVPDPDWQPDELIALAIAKIEQFQKEGSSTYNYYMSAKFAIEKMQTFYMNFDLTEVNPKTLNPIYKPKDITNAVADTEKVLANLKGLEKKVEEELYEKTRTKSDKQISPFANPDSL